jgi:hypothetical protein
MNVRRDAVCFAALLVLTACPKKESDEDEKPKKKPAATAEVTATATATAAPVATPTPLATEAPVPTPAGGGIKAELDNRADGINGTTVSVPGAKATTVAAAGWKASKQGDVQVHAAPDEKARIAATSVGAEGPQKKLEAAATAAGLSGCTFGTAENVTVGKDKLAGQAAEGTCQRGFGAGMNAQQHIPSTHLRASLGDLIAADGEIDRIGGFGAAGAEFEDDVADAARVHAGEHAAGGRFELADERSAMHGGDFFERFDVAALQGDHLLEFGPGIAAMEHFLQIHAG